MQEVTSSQIISAIIVALIGFAFRLGLAYENDKKMPGMWNVVFLFLFSMGTGGLAFLFVIERGWTPTLKLIPIWAASFFGSMIVTGLGGIKGEFFADTFKDIIRKWVNSNGKKDEKSDGEIPTNDEM